MRVNNRFIKAKEGEFRRVFSSSKSQKSIGDMIPCFLGTHMETI